MNDVAGSTRRGLLGLIGAALLAPASARALGAVGTARRGGAARSATGATLAGAAFGTTWRIDGASADALESLRPGIDELFGGIDRQMSPWRHDSALSRFNAGSAGWHAADDELVHVTRCAVALAARSGGAFDPTVGPLVARWGFGPIEGGEPDWRALSVDTGRIAKARADLTLDLCGIAKGRALDRAVELAAAAGLDDLLFDLGGELRALGHHPAGREWRVAVRHPERGRAVPAALRLPPGRGVATSGPETQGYALAGRTYGHIIDPAARAPVDTGLRSVTVVAEDAMTADGWATALFAAGEGAGLALCEEHDIAALFLVGEGRGLRRLATGPIEGLLL